MLPVDYTKLLKTLLDEYTTKVILTGEGNPIGVRFVEGLLGVGEEWFQVTTGEWAINIRNMVETKGLVEGYIIRDGPRDFLGFVETPRKVGDNKYEADWFFRCFEDTSLGVVKEEIRRVALQAARGFHYNPISLSENILL